MKKLSQTNWLYISLAGVIVFLLVFYFLVQYGEKIRISLPIYFILVVFIALLCTAFLSGAMNSVARYSSTLQNKTLYISGPAVIFFIIVYLGYKYRPEPSANSLSLSILLRGPGGVNELIQEGTLTIRVGEYSATKQISNEGTASFTGIPSNYKGSALDLGARVPGCFVKDDQTIALSADDHTNLKIELSKTPDETKIQGRVISLPTREGISGVSVTFQGVDTVLKTDESGAFRAVLPLKSGTQARVIVVKGNREIYNSLRTLTNNDFLSLASD